MKTKALALLAAAASLTASADWLPVAAGPKLYWVEQDRIVLTVRPIEALAAEGIELPRVFEVPDRGAETEFTLRWPHPDSSTVVRLSAAPRPARAGAPHVLGLAAEVDLPDGRRVRSEREITFDDTTTVLYDICSEGERALTLAIVAESSRETTLASQPAVGAPIQLHLEIQRLEAGAAISLETNRLNTFVGEPVSYSFRLGEPGVADAFEVRLRPDRLLGELARIEIEVSGTMPDGEKVAVFSRNEAWMTSRGATSALTVATGEPPTGFRFLVTPYF